jgi:uncharacterized protein YecE (DUF72 family)
MEHGAQKVYVGTSGWHYSHWAGPFYPDSLPAAEWLEYYAGRFSTVELNSTFYHMPCETTVAGWAKLVPEGFIFAVKASRYITHIRRLRDVGDSVGLFEERISRLGRKLGPVLYQLPPGMHKDLGLLEAFAALLRGQTVAVFEFRHKSWFADDTYELMERQGLAFCVHDWNRVQTPMVRTGRCAYIRLHGPTGRYGGCYTDHALGRWAEWIENQAGEGAKVFVYFNNDAEGYAVANATWLTNRLANRRMQD